MEINIKSGMALIKSALSRSKGVDHQGFFGANLGNLFGTETPNNIGNTSDWLDEYHTNPRLAGVNKIATDNGTADFGIYKTDPKTHSVVRVVNHPLEKEIADHTIPMFFSLWTAYRLMTGTSYIAYELKDGSPNNFRIFSETHLTSSEEGHYRFQQGGLDFSYPKNQVIKDLDLDLNNPYQEGKGRMTSLAEEIELDSWIVRYLKNFYINSAQPGMFIIPKGEETPDSEDLERLATSLRTSHKGIGNAGKTAVLSFPADIKTVPSSHKDLELLETRKALRDAGIQHIGIPPEIMGIVENSNKATVVAAEHIYAKQVRMPILKHFEDIINSKILPKYAGSEGLYFQFSDILPDDEEMGISKAKEGREAGSITVNEHRAYLGLAPIEGVAGNYLVGGDVEVTVTSGAEQYEEEEYQTHKETSFARKVSSGRIENINESVTILLEEEEE